MHAPAIIDVAYDTFLSQKFTIFKISGISFQKIHHHHT